MLTAFTVLISFLQPSSAFVPSSNQHISDALPASRTSVVSFQVQHARPSSPVVYSSKKEDDSPSQANYNDDAFGLVFLWTAVAKDIPFAGTFLVLSAIAATGTNTGVWNRNADVRIPAAVAVVSLLLRPLVVEFAVETDPVLDMFPFLGPLPLPAVGVTVASTVWALFTFQKEQQDA